MDHKNEHVSFRETVKRGYGRNAVAGLLGGLVLNIPHLTTSNGLNEVFGLIGGLLALWGAVCAVIWTYRLIKGGGIQSKLLNLFSKVKENKKIILVFLIICAVSYWFIWRPAHIRKVCATSVKLNPASEYWQRLYSACLKANGFAE